MQKYTVNNYNGTSFTVEINEFGVKNVEDVPAPVAANLKASVKRHMKKHNLTAKKALGRVVGGYASVSDFEEEQDTVSELLEEPELE